MIPQMVYCDACGADFYIENYRNYVICPLCGTRFDLDSFGYPEIDWNKRKYHGVKKWTNCPACLSPNMYLDAKSLIWKCPDCDYTMSDESLKNSILWFCDHCETFMNVQEGFNTKSGRWKCTICGHDNDVTEKNII